MAPSLVQSSDRRHQAGLSRLSVTAFRADSIDQVFTEAVKVIGEALAAHSCHILQLDATGRETVVRAVQGNGEPYPRNVGANSWEEFTLSSETPVVVKPSAPRTFMRPLFRSDPGTVMNVALRARGGRAWGFLHTRTRGSEGFSSDDVRFYQTCAEMLGHAIVPEEIEKEIQSSRTDLEARVQLRTEELEAFTHAISHDIRGRLRAVETVATLISESKDSRLHKADKEALANIVRVADGMRTVVESLLRLGRISASPLTREWIDLSAMADQHMRELQEADPRGRVSAYVERGLRAFADRGLADILLQNLLSNAWKYVKPAAHPQIRVERVSTSPGVFVVRDNGVGFPWKGRDEIFRPFRRFHSGQQFQGTGLGLSIVKRVVANHGGRIWIESRPGKGTSVHFAFAADGAELLGDT